MLWVAGRGLPAHGARRRDERAVVQAPGQQWILMDLSNFRIKIHKKFGAWCKVLPERDQKRSGRKNHIILQSAI